MKSFRFHPEALLETESAAEFYKGMQSGLEKRFLAALLDAVSRARSNPMLYRKVAGNLRKCRLQHFPYGLFIALTTNTLKSLLLCISANDPVTGRREKFMKNPRPIKNRNEPHNDSSSLAP